MLPVLMKNLSKPGTPATVSMVAVGASPRLVHLNIVPQQETTLKYGAAVHKTQHFVVKIRIGGIAGVIAPLVGKQPPDIQFWILETKTQQKYTHREREKKVISFHSNYYRCHGRKARSNRR